MSIHCVQYIPSRLQWLIPSGIPSSDRRKLYNHLSDIQNTTFFVQLAVQAWTNRRWQTFAGSYGITAYLDLLLQLINWIYHIDRIVGVVEAKDGIHLLDLPYTIVATVLAWQALTLPKVVWREDEDEE